jgi:hypothetical protein
MRYLPIGAVLVALLLPAGCSDPNRGRVPVPNISPAGAAAAALAEYDRNKDGYLDPKELESCPALQGAVKAIDKDGDGRLSADEIADRLTAILESKVGRLTFSCEVTLNGAPLTEATVTFVPEKFLGSVVSPASGVTDNTGMVAPAVEGAAPAGMQPGYYRVTISKKDSQGRETIPARYNTQTILGGGGPQRPQRPPRLCPQGRLGPAPGLRRLGRPGGNSCILLLVGTLRRTNPCDSPNFTPRRPAAGPPDRPRAHAAPSR